jgi:hypothetical protein
MANYCVVLLPSDCADTYGSHANLTRWVTEYRIDGFNFHSLSSMLYTHNGFSTFTGAMEE